MRRNAPGVMGVTSATNPTNTKMPPTVFLRRGRASVNVFALSYIGFDIQEDVYAG